jgi:hypothetical protein
MGPLAVRSAIPGAALLASLCAWFGLGCVVDNAQQSSPPSAGEYSPTPSASVPNTGPTAPMLVKVDPNVSMTATPGEGVGVFSEYKSGGHWHVWWTCDTNRTGQSCAFDVKVTPASGSLSNVRSDQFGSADTLTESPLEAVTSTSTNTEGVYFDAVAGVAIKLDASVGGLRDGSFLFFVQDGQVNGGFTGVLTDPLLLEGSSP